MLTGQRATRLSPIYVTGCRGDELRGGGGKSGRAVLYANIPQGMGLQSRAWCLSPAQGAPPFLGGGLEQLRLLRDRPPPQLRSHQDQGLQRDQPPGTVWEREGLCEGPAQRERAPDVAEAGGQGPCGGADARGGRAWSSPAQLTWARTQATEAELLVSREDVGAPVPAGPRGTVGPQAALPAHPAAAGAGLPGGPGGPGTVPSHAARARAQRQLCATGRSSAGASPSPSRRSPGADPSSGSAMTSRTPHTATHRSDTLGACGFGHGATCRGLWMGPWGRGSGTHATGDLLEAGGAPRQCRGWHRAQSQTQTRDPASGPERGTCVGGVRCWFGVGHRLGVRISCSRAEVGVRGDGWESDAVRVRGRDPREHLHRTAGCRGAPGKCAPRCSSPGRGGCGRAKQGAQGPCSSGSRGTMGTTGPSHLGGQEGEAAPDESALGSRPPGSRAEEAAGSGLAFP